MAECARITDLSELLFLHSAHVLQKLAELFTLHMENSGFLFY